MAKVAGPLLSLEARGTIAGVMTFSQRKTGAQTRYQRKQKDVITPLRELQRAFFSMAISWWHMLTDDEQEEWDIIARKDC